MIKKVFCMMLCAVTCLTVCGCGNRSNLSAQQRFIQEYTSLNPDSFTAAENNNFSLEWDSENKRVVFYDKQNDIPWSYLPYEETETKYDEDGYEILSHPQISSPLSITYIDKKDNVIDTAIGYNECVKSNDFFVEKIENGISVTYFFSKKEISVTLDYVLYDDNFKISIDPAKICENDCRITDISVAPFLCSIPNGLEDSYLFFPSGCGTLIYADHTSDDFTVYTEETYGRDFFTPEDGVVKTETATVKLPVFGAKNGENAIMAIIENGAESTSISANVGNNNLRYSSVYAVFKLRGYESMVTNNGTQMREVYAEQCCTQPLTVAYYPLYGENADYVGMAKRYGKYLEDNIGFSSSVEQRMLNLEILGGKTVTSSFFGIPYNTVYASTTLSQAKDIINELSEKSGIQPAIQLLGFGKSGLDIGKIAGGIGISSSFGTKNDLSQLADLCGEKDIALFVDFDAVQFKKSSSVASVTYDTARTTNGRKATLYYYNLWSGTKDNASKGVNDRRSFFLLKRSLLGEVVNKICDFSLDLNLEGISLESLSTIAYSDYSERKYGSKGQMFEQVSNILKDIHSKGIYVAGNASNAYFAASSDYIFDVPSCSSKYDLYTTDVPFYQIAFKGNVPMASEPINTGADYRKKILEAVETGVGLTYVLSYNYNTDMIFCDDPRYFGSVYSSVSENIINAVEKTKEYYEAISKAHISDHETVSENVKMTVFDNGVTVYVNYGEEAAETSIGIVDAWSFAYVTGGATND